MHHVAIMRKTWGLTAKILAHQKTVESRWYARRTAPWGAINEGDTVYFKDTGDPVTVKATVRRVLSFSDLTPGKVRALLRTYGTADGLSSADIPRYYERFKDKRYCLLIFLRNVEPVAPFWIDKRGYGAMTAWITISSVQKLRIDR